MTKHIYAKKTTENVMVNWAVYDDGMRVWIDGELVAVIHPSQFIFMLKDIVKHIEEHTSWVEK